MSPFLEKLGFLKAIVRFISTAFCSDWKSWSVADTSLNAAAWPDFMSLTSCDKFEWFGGAAVSSFIFVRELSNMYCSCCARIAMKCGPSFNSERHTCFGYGSFVLAISQTHRLLHRACPLATDSFISFFIFGRGELSNIDAGWKCGYLVISGVYFQALNQRDSVCLSWMSNFVGFQWWSFAGRALKSRPQPWSVAASRPWPRRWRSMRPSST